ncbi:MAG: hypothetical protein AB3A66_27660 (plasmid) [Nodularia sp. CChRGM 3473]|jgi:hypothetical protein
MAQYRLKRLLKGSQRLLEKVNAELRGNNSHVATALKSINAAVNNTQDYELEAKVDYQVTLEEILKDDEEWTNHPRLWDMKPPSQS